MRPPAERPGDGPCSGGTWKPVSTMPQWFEQAIVEKLVERLTRGDLDDTCEHVDADAIVPDFAGLMGERNLRDARHEVLQRGVAREELPIKREPRRSSGIGIDEARGMAQQVLDDHRTLLRLERAPPLAARRICRLDGDHRVLELGKILGDRSRKIELALLDQHHGGDAGHRLAHRGDPEDRIALQRAGLCQVAEAGGAQIGDLAVAGNRCNRAREGAGIDLRLLPGGDPRQPRRREAECSWIAHRRGVVGPGRGRKAEDREGKDRQGCEMAMQALHPDAPFSSASDARRRHRPFGKICYSM